MTHFTTSGKKSDTSRPTVIIYITREEMSSFYFHYMQQHDRKTAKSRFKASSFSFSCRLSSIWRSSENLGLPSSKYLASFNKVMSNDQPGPILNKSSTHFYHCSTHSSTHPLPHLFHYSNRLQHMSMQKFSPLGSPIPALTYNTKMFLIQALRNLEYLP